MADKKIQWVAHRGHAWSFPENTMPAFKAALKAGSLWLETDVQLSQDGQCVLFHDENLGRLCHLTGSVHELNWEQLKKLAVQKPSGTVMAKPTAPMASLNDLRRLLATNPP